MGKQRDVERPSLGTMAFTSYVFAPLSDYDRSLKEFRDKIDGPLNLTQKDQNVRGRDQEVGRRGRGEGQYPGQNHHSGRGSCAAVPCLHARGIGNPPWLPHVATYGQPRNEQDQ